MAGSRSAMARPTPTPRDRDAGLGASVDVPTASSTAGRASKQCSKRYRITANSSAATSTPSSTPAERREMPGSNESDATHAGSVGALLRTAGLLVLALIAGGIALTQRQQARDSAEPRGLRRALPSRNEPTRRPRRALPNRRSAKHSSKRLSADRSRSGRHSATRGVAGGRGLSNGRDTTTCRPVCPVPTFTTNTGVLGGARVVRFTGRWPDKG